jgi:hypothetical protein
MTLHPLSSVRGTLVAAPCVADSVRRRNEGLEHEAWGMELEVCSRRRKAADKARVGTNGSSRRQKTEDRGRRLARGMNFEARSSKLEARPSPHLTQPSPLLQGAERGQHSHPRAAASALSPQRGEGRGEGCVCRRQRKEAE